MPADVLQRSPPPPPAYLSERLLFNAAELEQVNYLSSFLFTYAPYYMQGVSICTSLPCNSIITIPYVPVTSDIITLDPSIDTSDQLAELIAVDGTIFGYYGWAPACCFAWLAAQSSSSCHAASLLQL